MTKQNNKPKLYIMCGISGSGKSTTAKQIAEKENCVIVSSDSIRTEICEGGVYDQSKNEEVFKIFHDRIRKNLETKKNVIADATNITLKSRRAILNKVKGLDVEKIAYIMAKPYEDCIKDNNNSDRVPVPEEVIKRQVMKFQVPFMCEGLDKIIIHNFESNLKLNLNDFVQQMNGFNQMNPHHTMNLFEHCKYTSKWFRFFTKYEYDTEYYIGALLHDYGKLQTQTFDENGIAHYYQHHSVGAYKILTCLNKDFIIDNDRKLLNCCFLINYHMMPFDWNTEKAHNKWKKIFGVYQYQLLIDFHKCDKARPDIEKTN